MLDDIVLGLGGMGSAAARELAARGRRVLGIEQYDGAHDLGSSHGGSRMVRQAYWEHPAYVPLILRSYELYERLERDADTTILTRTGGLLVGKPASTVVAGSLAAAHRWDLQHEIVSAEEIRRRFPTFTPADDEVAFWEAAAGLVRPELTVRSQLILAASHGASLHVNEPVLGWRATAAGGVEVRTAKDVYAAERLIICPGAWAARVLADLDLPVRVEPRSMHWLRPTGRPDDFDVGHHPVFVHEDETGHQIYGFPAIDGPGGGVKVAYHHGGAGPAPSGDPSSLNRCVDEDETTALQARLSRILPTLQGPRLKAVACMYTMTPDGHFVIGLHPHHENVIVACGFSGHGFKFVPVIGQVLADLAIDGSTSYPIELFSPTRPALVNAGR